MAAEIAAQIDAAVERYLNTPAEHPGAMFDHLYAELPAAYEAQRAEAVAHGHG
jgi:pyruvate dehydrogenase E1 component alpha subunit